MALITPFCLQYLQNHHHCVPVPGRSRRTKQFVDLAKIADRFHVTTIYSENKPVSYSENSHKPLSRGWDVKRKARLHATAFRQDAHESNHLRTWWHGSKRIVLF